MNRNFGLTVSLDLLDFSSSDELLSVGLDLDTLLLCQLLEFLGTLQLRLRSLDLSAEFLLLLFVLLREFFGLGH